MSAFCAVCGTSVSLGRRQQRRARRDAQRILCRACEQREADVRSAGLAREYRDRVDAHIRAVTSWLESAPFYDASHLAQATERYRQDHERRTRPSMLTEPSTVTVPMSAAIEAFRSLTVRSGTHPCPRELAPGPRPDEMDSWDIATGGVPPGHHEVLRLRRYLPSVAGIGGRDWYAGSVFRSYDGICLLWRWYDSDTFID